MAGESFPTRVLNTLKNIFGVATVKNTDISGGSPIVPAVKNDPGENGKPRPLKMDSDFQKFWNWWLTECTDTSETLNDRLERIQDLHFMRHNSGIIELAVDMYADEATQVDSQRDLIQVKAEDPEVEREIHDLFEVMGISQSRVRAQMEDIAFLGESFSIDSFEAGRGLIESTHSDPRVVKDRIEFRLGDAMTEFLSANGNRYSVQSHVTRLQGLQNVLDNLSSDTSNYFRTFLFGYQLTNDVYLPPWNISHARRFTTQKEVHPWGLSLFFHSVSLFRQLKAASGLAAVGRALSLPREVFDVETGQKTSAAQRWQAINDAREQYNNISSLTMTKENLPIGAQVWKSAGLVDYTVVTPEINLNNVKDIEMLRDDLIISTRIPKGYLIIDRGGWGGSSGQALLHQYKPFGRGVFSVQSAYLEALAHQIRLHFLIKGKFQGEMTPFELAMTFPVIEDSQDRLRARTDSLTLAQTVIDNIQQALGVEDPLPIDVVRSIFMRLSFLTPEEVDDWLNTSYKFLVTSQEEMDKRTFSEEQLERKRKSNYARIREGLTPALIKQVEFNCRTSRMIKEGVQDGRHFYISRQNSFAIDRKQDYLFVRSTLFNDKGERKPALFEKLTDLARADAVKTLRFSDHLDSTHPVSPRRNTAGEEELSPELTEDIRKHRENLISSRSERQPFIRLH